MKKALIFGTTTLLCSLLAAPVAFADRDDDRDGRQSEWRHHEHRHDSKKIQHLRAELERDKAERRRAEWAYNQARRVGDWPTVRFQQARLDRLDQKIRHDQYELHRTYEQAQRDRRHRHDAWRDEYSYGHDRN